MSIQTKKRFKNLGKIIGVTLFAILMFTNIKIALMDDKEIASGDISVLGIEMHLFEATFGESGTSCNRILVIHDWMHLPACITWGGNCCPDV
jgi:hypothetical protein